MRAAQILLFVVCVAAGVRAGEPLTSGVPVGQRPGPYSFLVATGKERGQLTCFICDQQDKQGAIVFARTMSEPLGKLLLELDAECARNGDFKAWLTMLTPNADMDELAKWSQTVGLKNVPVGAFEDADGPPAYTLHADADVTVLLFEKRKVLANFAYRKDGLTAAEPRAIAEAIAKHFKK